MPSSIFSSDRRWLLVWPLALLLAALGLGAVEWHWRGLDYRPKVLDSMQLWSLQRDRVYGDGRVPLVLLGASRIEFGVDPAVLAEHLPGYRPLMLAIDGHYPIATLRDLAADTDFRGVVLCDVESNGLLAAYHDMQQPYVDYYRTRWSPHWRWHRRLLTLWQQRAVIADPRLGALATLRQAWLGGQPYRDYVRFYADRSGAIDYALTDVEGAKRHFAETVEGNIDRLPAHDPDSWLAGLEPVFADVRRIQQRGGQVIFYESPLHGLQHKVMERVYPRADYWDRFAAASPAPVLSAQTVPALMAFPLPDDSHLDARDRAAYTRALADELLERQLLPRLR